MNATILPLLGWAVVGAAIGTYGTLVGAGGGFIIVPVLLLVVPGISPAEAAGTSLAVVLFNALSGTASYLRQGRVDVRTGITFAVATLPGSVVGVYLSGRFASRAFYIVFGLLLIIIAVFLNLRPDPRAARRTTTIDDLPRRWVARTLTDRTGARFAYAFDLWQGIALSFVVGFISSIFGIGGGIIHVPAMVFLFNFPAHIATATSTFILTISALAGTVSHLIAGDIRWVPMLGLTAGAIPGAQLGARLAQYVRGPWLLRALSISLVIVGIRLVFKT